MSKHPRSKSLNELFLQSEFWETHCEVKDGILPFYPFAFRVHAHHLGRAIMGYKIDPLSKEWTRIGVMDPM